MKRKLPHSKWVPLDTLICDFIREKIKKFRSPLIAYKTLVEYINHDKIYPGIRKLCELSGMTDKTMTKGINELEAIGVISIDRKKEGTREMRIYHIKERLQIPGFLNVKPEKIANNRYEKQILALGNENITSFYNEFSSKVKGYNIGRKDAETLLKFADDGVDTSKFNELIPRLEKDKSFISGGIPTIGYFFHEIKGDMVNIERYKKELGLSPTAPSSNKVINFFKDIVEIEFDIMKRNAITNVCGRLSIEMTNEEKDEVIKTMEESGKTFKETV